jgi:hypothetical protein
MTMEGVGPMSAYVLAWSAREQKLLNEARLARQQGQAGQAANCLRQALAARQQWMHPQLPVMQTAGQGGSGSGSGYPGSSRGYPGGSGGYPGSSSGYPGSSSGGYPGGSGGYPPVSGGGRANE